MGLQRRAGLVAGRRHRLAQHVEQRLQVLRVGLLAVGQSAFKAVVYASLVAFALSFLDRTRRMTPPRLLAALDAPVTIDGWRHAVTASLGVALCGPGHARSEDLLRDADAALYRAKAAGRARHASDDADR